MRRLLDTSNHLRRPMLGALARQVFCLKILSLTVFFPTVFLLTTAVLAGPALGETIHIDENAGAAVISIQSQGAWGAEIRYRMESFGIVPLTIDGEPMKLVTIPGVILPNKAGAPNLPGMGRYIALPQGASADLETISTRTRTYQGIEIAPAPVIPKENDDSPPVYEKDPLIYERNAFYPESPATFSEPFKMRGLDVVILAISPFQYNPVTKELIVHTQLDIRVSFQGAAGQFGDDRLRSRHWEPILRGHLLNYGSLSQIDFGGLRGGRYGYEYVIITPDHPDFIAWGDTLKAWRKLQGISTEVFTTTDIGGTDPTTIQTWIHNAYNEWDVAPSAFLILGDYPGSGDNRDSGVIAPIWNSHCVSDNMYADAEGDDDLPDMAHGRITARDGSELETMIGKLLSYERDPYVDPGFYDHPVMTGGWQDDRWFILCCEIILGFQENILGKQPVREYGICSGGPAGIWSSNQNTQMIVDYFGPGGLGYVPATPDHLTDWGANAARLNNDIDSGAYFVVHRDHGAPPRWGVPDYRISDLWLLQNEMYPFVFSINCLTGKYNHAQECFVEAFHRIEHGALGLVAASEESYSFVNDTFVWGMLDGLWPQFDPGYPEPCGREGGDNLGASDLRTAFAMASGKYYLAPSNWPTNPDRKAHVYHLFHHHGDAFVQMYSQIPQQLTVLHDGICPLNQDTFTIQANEGSVIALTVDGEIIGVADATGEEQQVSIIPQTQSGMLRITVTKANHFRYDVTIPIGLPVVVVRPDGTGDYPTIQAAVDAASDGWIIELTNGTFTGEGNRDVDYLGKAITIRSQNGNPQACMIVCGGSAAQPHRGFLFDSAEGLDSVLEGVTIAGGYAPWLPDPVYASGGAICCGGSGAAPTLTNCVFSGNQATWGGGAIYCWLESSSPLALTNCTFTGNTASGGGALVCEGASPVITGCTFAGNSSDLGCGGAVNAICSSPTFVDCAFLYNYSAYEVIGGGAIFCDGVPTFSGCTFFDNSTEGPGGAVYLMYAYSPFTDCTFSGNSSQISGGAIYWGFLCGSRLTGCTFSGNSAPVGGGLCLGGTLPLTLENTILAFSPEGEAIALLSGAGANITCCDIYGNAGGDWVGNIADQLGINGNFSLDPCFCDPGAGDYYLWNYSPCAQENCGQIGAWPIGCWDPQGAREHPETPEMATELLLGGNTPNPFGSSTLITYTIPSKAGSTPVLLSIYDAAGRLVRTLVDSRQMPGKYAARWDATDRNGDPVAGGIYYSRLTAGGKTATRPIVLIQ